MFWYALFNRVYFSEPRSETTEETNSVSWEKWRIQREYIQIRWWRWRRGGHWGLWHRAAAGQRGNAGPQAPQTRQGGDAQPVQAVSAGRPGQRGVPEVHSRKAGRGWHWPLRPTFRLPPDLCFWGNRVLSWIPELLRLRSLWSRWKLWLS